jgi:adenine-specific DNA-methyltransferase
MKNPCKTELAQFYTPAGLALRAAELLRGTGKLLEPSCGDGSLLRAVRAAYKDFETTAIEVDPVQAADASFYADVLYISDFFELRLEPVYDAVILNPPYLAYRKVPEYTKALPLFKHYHKFLGGYANLYSYFLLHSFQLLKNGGEMVAIVPSEVFNATGNAKLNNHLHKHGTFTDVIKFSKSPFSEVTPDVVVFRYEKGRMSRQTNVVVVK